MPSLNVNMPKELREHVDRRTSEGGYGTPTEFVRQLIRKDKETEAERELERLVLEGMRSGRSRTDVKRFLARVHKRIDELEGNRKRRGAKADRPNTRR